MFYCFQTTLIWGSFALLYTLVFRFETFHRINRGYLLTAIILGLLLPILGRNGWSSSKQLIELPEIVVTTIQNADQTAVTAAFLGWKWIYWLGWIWAIGAAIGLCRFCWGLYRIFSMLRHATVRQINDGQQICYTAETALPCTFFNCIFVPHYFDQHPDAAKMLAHERGHARGWHSADVLLLEILCVVLWWHPLVYWFRSALRLVHEYEADAAAIRQSSKQQYGLLLIRQAQSGPAFALVHHFYQSPLKQRLIMLTKHHSAPKRGWKYTLLLPVIAIFFTLCKAPDDLIEADVQPVFPGGQEMLMKYLGSNIKYPTQSRTARSEGTVAIEFIVDKDGTIEQADCINREKMKDEALIEEAKRVITNMPAWEPGTSNGKPVKVKYVLPIKFKLD